MADRNRTSVGRIALTAFVLAALAPALAGCLADKTAEDTVTGNIGVAPPSVSGEYSGGAAAEPGLPADADAQRSIAPAPEGSGTDASTVPAEDRLIITSKNMRIEVDDVNGTVAKVRALATKYKGNVVNLQVSTQPDMPVYNAEASSKDGSYDNAALSGWMTVRVPADKYQAFVDEAAKIGKVLRQSEDTQDVTQEHVDLAARLGNLRAEEKRLREFFDAAKSVEDMLKIEAELSRVRGEIEAMDAQIKYLERQAAMATVTFELVEPTPIVSSGGEDWGVKNAFTESIRWFVGTMNALIVLLGPALAIGIFIVLPVYLVVRWLIKREQVRRAARAKAPEEAEQ